MVRDVLRPDRAEELPAPNGHPVECFDAHAAAGDVTRILAQAAGGSPQASEQLLPLVYDELRRLAAQNWRAKRPARRSSPRRSCMKPTCDSWGATKFRSGTVATISSSRQRRPCGGS